MNQDPHEPAVYGEPKPVNNPYAAPSFPVNGAVAPVVEAPATSLAQAQVKAAASWFFWIGGLSLVNSLIIHFGGNWNFVVGLGLTQVVDVVMKQLEGAGVAIAVVFDLMAASVCLAFGLLARRMMMWPFILGMVLYALDGLLLLYFGDLMGVGFHAFALFQLYAGIRALRSVQLESVPTPV